MPASDVVAHAAGALREAGFLLTERPVPDTVTLTLVAHKRCSEGGELLLYRRPADLPGTQSWLELAADTQFDWLEELQRRVADSAGKASDRLADRTDSRDDYI